MNKKEVTERVLALAFVGLLAACANVSAQELRQREVTVDPAGSPDPLCPPGPPFHLAPMQALRVIGPLPENEGGHLVVTGIESKRGMGPRWHFGVAEKQADGTYLLTITIETPGAGNHQGGTTHQARITVLEGDIASADPVVLCFSGVSHSDVGLGPDHGGHSTVSD